MFPVTACDWGLALPPKFSFKSPQVRSEDYDYSTQSLLICKTKVWSPSLLSSKTGGNVPSIPNSHVARMTRLTWTKRFSYLLRNWTTYSLRSLQATNNDSLSFPQCSFTQWVYACSTDILERVGSGQRDELWVGGRIHPSSWPKTPPVFWST